MASLNNIAENIAFNQGEQFNDTLKQSIKDSIVEHRAMLLRQDLDNNPLSFMDYLQSFVVELKEVARAGGGFELRSIQPVPLPLRIKNNGRSNFKFVGSIDRSVSFTFEHVQAYKYMCHLPLQSDTIYYTYINGHLIVQGTLRPCKILVEGVLADPRLVKDCNFPHTFPDDLEFPIPVDMIVKLKTFIKREYLSNPTDGKEIQIEQDDRS